VIKVEEFHDGGTLVVRADLRVVDPDRDVDITVDDGRLTILASNEVASRSFTHSLPLADGVDADYVTASYVDGTLEVRAPLPSETPTAPRRIPVTKA
jgi:HSP20 family protein